MTCSLSKVELFYHLGKKKFITECTIIDYRDGKWGIKLGSFGCQVELRLDDVAVDNLIKALSAMQDDNYMDTIGGDFEKEAREEMDW